MLTVLFFVGLGLGSLGLIMTFPGVYALALGEAMEARAFLGTAAVLVFVAGGLFFALRGRLAVHGRPQMLALVAAIWALLPLGGALPLYFAHTELGFLPAYFEAVSGFTTTGATIFSSVSDLSRAVVLWRALLQWMGGLATYLVLLVLLGPLAGPQLMGRAAVMFTERTSLTMADVGEALRFILPLYGGLTALCFGGLVLSGVPLFDSASLAMAAVSSGGFMPHDGNITLYGSPLAELVLAVFMYLAAVSLLWIHALFTRRWKQVFGSWEPWAIALAIVLLTLFLGLGIWERQGHEGNVSYFHVFTLALATATSFLSTTGLDIGGGGEAHLPYMAVLVLALIGGGRFSTSGGMKFSRIGALLLQSVRELDRLLYPHALHPRHHWDMRMGEAMMGYFWTSFATLAMLVWMVALGLSAFDIPLTAAFMASVGAFGNFGPVYDLMNLPAAANVPTYGEMAPGAQLLLIGAMILGRVEILALLSLFSLAYWRS